YVGGTGLPAALDDVQPVCWAVHADLLHGVFHGVVRPQHGGMVLVHQRLDILPAGDGLAAENAGPVRRIQFDVLHAVGDGICNAAARSVVLVDVVLVHVGADPVHSGGGGKLPGVAGV